jgi:spermidine synthase
MFISMADKVPEGSLGKAIIKHFTIGPIGEEISALRAIIQNDPDEALGQGSYCQLFVDGVLMMSDTPMEHRTNVEVVDRAHGYVFIAGLGIGMILIPILQKPEVTKVTVVEKSQDVIDLVGPNFTNPKLEIVCADVYNYIPQTGTKYDTIYFDIWPNLSSYELRDMERLHKRYQKYRAVGGWMESWKRKELRKRLARRLRK